MFSLKLPMSSPYSCLVTEENYVLILLSSCYLSYKHYIHSCNQLVLSQFFSSSSNLSFYSSTPHKYFTEMNGHPNQRYLKLGRSSIIKMGSCSSHTNYVRYLTNIRTYS